MTTADLIDNGSEQVEGGHLHLKIDIPGHNFQTTLELLCRPLISTLTKQQIFLKEESLWVLEGFPYMSLLFSHSVRVEPSTLYIIVTSKT